jgi:hypothetical protein
MKRSIKNLVMIIMVALMCALIYFTVSNINVSSSPQGMDNSMMQQPSNQGEQKPDDSNGQTSEKPDDSNGQNEEKSNENGQNGEKPNDSNSLDVKAPDDMMKMDEGGSISKVYYVALTGETLALACVIIYLVMSKFNKLTFFETYRNCDKVIIMILSVCLLTESLVFGEVYYVNHYLGNNSNNMETNNTDVTTSGAVEVTTSQTLCDDYTSTTADQNVILVKDKGSALIEGATISKDSGDSSNTENSEFYGVNAGVLVEENSTATIKNAIINTNANGSNAVFSTGSDSKIYISQSTITTLGESSSRGLDATYGGYIEAEDVTITTQGNSCATVATDRGEGTVKVTSSSLETNGTGSPVVYSTGDITLKDCKGNANSSQNIVIEGKNSVTINNTELTASGTGNRGDVDQCGVMIYQSMSGDASEGEGIFNSVDSTLTIFTTSSCYKEAPMFFVTNTDATINLENTKLNFGSGILLSAKGTSEWGNEQENGGNVTFNATKQTLEGDIELDALSQLSLNLTHSTYTGTINGDNKAKNVSLKLDKDSKIVLTGDSYVSSLENEVSDNSNIDYNGYHLYVNGQ